MTYVSISGVAGMAYQERGGSGSGKGLRNGRAGGQKHTRYSIMKGKIRSSSRRGNSWNLARRESPSAFICTVFMTTGSMGKPPY